MILLLQTSKATNVHSFYRSKTNDWNVRYLLQKGVEKNKECKNNNRHIIFQSDLNGY